MSPKFVTMTIPKELLWAGLNLTPADLPRSGGADRVSPYYPIELLRALAAVWLFAGLRSDEIVRLRVGCVRWSPEEVDMQTGKVMPKNAVCLFDVPVNKTGTAFTKPVDPVAG